MARVEQPTIAIATRTFQDGATKQRIKAGTRFAIDKPQGDLPVITLARFRQLSGATGTRLMRGLNDADLKAVQRPVYQDQAEAIAAREKAEKKAPGVAARTARPSPRVAARRKTQVAEPQAPERINGASVTVSRAGSPIGAALPQSSSQADPQSKPSAPSSRKRGTRRA